jgi:hypothetical protein
MSRFNDDPDASKYDFYGMSTNKYKHELQWIFPESSP